MVIKSLRMDRILTNSIKKTYIKSLRFLKHSYIYGHTHQEKKRKERKKNACFCHFLQKEKGTGATLRNLYVCNQI